MSIPESKSQPLRAAMRLVIVACALAVLSVASVALAAGRTQWTNVHPKERDDGSWHLEVAIFMARAPDVPHIPVKFEFKPTAYYERDMVDGDKITERKVPLANNQDIIEDVDIGFLDPSNGKIQKRTKFSFKITRAHGFEAGEYTVTIRDGRNGQVIGTSAHFVLDGENKVIDRRTMVFSGDDKKKKKKKKTEMKKIDRNGDVEDDANGGGTGSADKGDKGDKKASGGENSGGNAAASSDTAASDEPGASDEPSGDNGENGGPPPVKEKPGCNCRMERTSTPASPVEWLAPLGLVFALGLRRRRAR